MVDIFVSLLLELVDFCGQLPLVLFAVFYLSHCAERPLRGRELRMHGVLHDHVVITLKHVGVLILLEIGILLLLTISLVGCTTLHFHHHSLLLDGLGIGCNASHLSYPLLFKLPFPRLHLLDKDLGLKIIRFHLSDELLVSRVLLTWYARIFLLNSRISFRFPGLTIRS